MDSPFVVPQSDVNSDTSWRGNMRIVTWVAIEHGQDLLKGVHADSVLDEILKFLNS